MMRHKLSVQAAHANNIDALTAKLKAADTAAQRWGKKLADSQAEVKQLRQELRTKSRQLSFFENSWQEQTRKREEMSETLHETQQSLHSAHAKNRHLSGPKPPIDERTRERLVVLSQHSQRLEKELADKDGVVELHRRENAALKQELNLLAHAVDIRDESTRAGQPANGSVAIECAKLKSQVLPAQQAVRTTPMGSSGAPPTGRCGRWPWTPPRKRP
jgi:flagellar biosynthesis regulator FlaF